MTLAFSMQAEISTTMTYIEEANLYRCIFQSC